MCDELICPNCGKPIKLENYFKPFYHWEDERTYYYPTNKGMCNDCHIKYDDGEWDIPEELLPTEKQKRTVAFIRNRLDIPNEDAGLTKQSYWEFINKYFEQAKKTEPPHYYDEDLESIFDIGDFC